MITKNSISRWTFFVLFSFILLLCLSPDSWLSHLCGPRFDSAWFFTAGRAWMEGLVPYVDFADSKGPVLWLIYGIGYLISPTSYTGIFLQSVVYFTVSFYFLWLTARLFVGQREALVVLFVMPVMLFFRAYLIETRAEDFMQPWLFMSLYVTCRCLKQPSRNFIRWGAFWMGVGMVFCLLVKWNMFFMMGGMALTVVGVSFSRKSADGLLFGLLGMVVMAMPFIVYFLIEGNFGAFVQDYFVNTYLITDTDTTSVMFHKFFSNLFANKLETLKTAVLLLPFLGMWQFCRSFKMSYWLIFSYVPFYLFLALKAPFFHYCSMAVPFYVFLFVVLAQKSGRWLGSLSRLRFAMLLLFIYVATIGYSAKNANLWFKPNGYTVEWNSIQQIMMKKEKPKFMFTGNDMGQGLLSRALPGCKYWAHQSGSTPEMVAERKNAIRARKLDFIVVTQIPSADLIPLIERCGYHQCHGLVYIKGKAQMRALPLYEKR